MPRWGKKLLGGALVALGLACTPAPCGEEAGDLCLVAGTGKLGFNRDGLPPAETEFYLVSSARRSPDGRLYLVDFNNQRLRRLGDDGRIETIAGNGFHAIADLGLPAVESPLENPIDLRFLSDGRLVFVSYHDPRVLALTPDGALERIAGDPEGQVGVDGDEGDGGSPLDARFIQLDGIAVAKDGAIYVSDSRAHRVRRIHGGVITTVAGTGEAEFSGDGGAATAAALFWPTALEIDDDGELWIADTFNHRIRRLRSDQTIETVAGSGVAGDHGDRGPAIAAGLNQPMGLALDPEGTLYIADRGNFRLRRVDTAGIIDTVAGTGTQGMAFAEGPAADQRLGHLARLDYDDGGLLIVDQSNARILRLALPAPGAE